MPDIVYDLTHSFGRHTDLHKSPPNQCKFRFKKAMVYGLIFRDIMKVYFLQFIYPCIIIIFNF